MNYSKIRPLQSDRDILKELNDQMESGVAYAREKAPGSLWMFEIQRAYWSDIYKKAVDPNEHMILMGGNGPMELAYALDAAGFLLPPFSVRVSSSKDGPRYIDAAEKYVPQSFCSLDSLNLGMALSGDLKQKTTAMIITTMPCDSERAAHPLIADVLDIPTFCIDTPYLKNERGYRYIADQLKECMKFLEDVTGRKMNPARMAEVGRLSNEASRLLGEVAAQRKHVPCPLPGSLTLLNGLAGSMQGTQALVDFLQAEKSLGEQCIAAGKSATKGPEQFRIMWLQNHVWNIGTGIMGWLEKEYNAVMVMDGFGFNFVNGIQDVNDPDSFYMGVAERMMNYPMVHGAGGPAKAWMRWAAEIVEEYKIDTVMYMGHIGCKHTWAAGKMVKDYLMDKFGLPTLTVDLDSIDVRFKSLDEVKTVIAEFMDTLVEKKKAAAR